MIPDRLGSPVTHDLYDDTPGSDEDEHEGLDPEGPSAADLDRFGDGFRVCPGCGSAVYDEAPLCPECGHMFEERTGTPVWLVITAAVVLVGLIMLFVL